MEKLLHKYQILSKRGFAFLSWSSKSSIRYRGCLVTKLCPTPVTPWTAAHQAPLSSTISQSLLKFMSIESVMLASHLILCHPLLLLPSIFPSLRVFSNELTLQLRWPQVASVLPVNIQGWFPLGLTALISLLSKGLSRVFSRSIIWKHQLFCAQPSSWSNSHIHTWVLEKL